MKAPLHAFTQTTVRFNNDKVIRHQFYIDFQSKSGKDDSTAENVIFSDELIFLLSGKMNRH